MAGVLYNVTPAGQGQSPRYMTFPNTNQDARESECFAFGDYRCENLLFILPGIYYTESCENAKTLIIFTTFLVDALNFVKLLSIPFLYFH